MQFVFRHETYLILAIVAFIYCLMLSSVAKNLFCSVVIKGQLETTYETVTIMDLVIYPLLILHKMSAEAAN